MKFLQFTTEGESHFFSTLTFSSLSMSHASAEGLAQKLRNAKYNHFVNSSAKPITFHSEKVSCCDKC